VLFASLLGYNPVRTLLGPVIAHLPPGHAAYLTGRGFFPSLISPAFSHGLSIAFDFAIAACLIAAVASLLRGGRYVHDEHAPAAPGGAADTPRGGAVAVPPGLAAQARDGSDRTGTAHEAVRLGASGRRRAARTQ
ncbi:MAG TPA: MFS transporter, partial [Bacillota bacterium]|nr:MFS transporter [Bacillota bacterium]